MSRSSRLCPASISAAAARTEPSEARSRRTTETVAPGAAAVILAAAAAALPTSRQARRVFAPRRASTPAASNPRPEFAPVTTAVRPLWSGTSTAVQGPCLTLIGACPSAVRPPADGGRVSRLPCRVETGAARGRAALAGAPRGPGTGGYAQTHGHAYPQPVGQRLPHRLGVCPLLRADVRDRKSTRLNSSHLGN